MALPASGAISINAINVELGRAGATSASLNDANLRALAGVPSGAISMSNFHGKSLWNLVAGNLVNMSSDSSPSPYTASSRGGYSLPNQLYTSPWGLYGNVYSECNGFGNGATIGANLYFGRSLKPKKIKVRYAPISVALNAYFYGIDSGGGLTLIGSGTSVYGSWTEHAVNGGNLEFVGVFCYFVANGQILGGYGFQISEWYQ